VTNAALKKLEEEVGRLEPDVVISSVAARADYGQRLAWVELSLDPARPSMVCVGGRNSELSNPGLDVLLKIVDEAERLFGKENTGAR
jgi:hypothetical protein